MSVIQDLRKTVDTTPFFAAVGVTDLAVEKVREARLRAEKARADLAPTKVQARATTLADQVREIPAVVINETLVIGGKVAEGYGDLATRGHQLVTRVRNQKATKDLIAQAETTVAHAKGAVTTARKATADVERSTKATITTARHEAARVASVVSGTVGEVAESASTEVETSVKNTRSAAKRTATTTKKAAKRTTSSAKGATTSARKTAAAAEKATEKAADKVGDKPVVTTTTASTTKTAGPVKVTGTVKA